MRYESWVERQVREAIERGEFDNLPGAGRPLPGIKGREDENWWVKSLLEREQLPMPLPTSLALRREVADLPQTLADAPDERAVRDIMRSSTGGSATRTADEWMVRRSSSSRST